MGISQLNIENVSVKLAETDIEVRASQRLRYRVFYEEYKATPTEEMARERRDIDDFDRVADHLVVIDKSIQDPSERIVGTYRLLRHDVAQKYGRYYTSDEYDISPLINGGARVLELGRSCVLAEYRTRPVMQRLWEGLATYMDDFNIETLFGCASLYGTDINALAEQLSYLHHYHLAPPEYRPVALKDRATNMNIIAKENLDARRIFRDLPPLIKGYLRTGCMIGEGAVVDYQFNTTDICIVLPVEQFADRYRNHYNRKIENARKDTHTDNATRKREAAAETNA